MKTIKVPDDVWEELMKLKVKWRNKTIGEVIVKLLDEFDESKQRSDSVKQFYVYKKDHV